MPDLQITTQLFVSAVRLQTAMSSLPVVDQKLTSESTPPPEHQQAQPSPQSTVDINVDNSPDAIPPPHTPSDKSYCFLPPSSVLLLTFMFAGSTYNARGNLRDVSFVLFCYTILLSLFYCLRKYERLDSDAPPRLRTSLKVGILLLTSGLNVAFASRASELVPWPFAAVIWASAAFVAVIGYLALFVWSNRVGSHSRALPYSKLDVNSNNNNNNNNNCKEEEERYFFRNELSPEDKAPFIYLPSP